MNELTSELPRTVGWIERGIREGLHTGFQLYVSLDGRPVASAGVGEGRRGVPMTAETIMPWLSCCKPVGAVAIGQLWEQGRLDLDWRVVQIIPEFSASGKEAVTLRHLLTHTGGFPNAPLKPRPASWEELVSGLCAAPLEPGWVPGEKAGYHVATSWVILAEVVRRLDGRPYEQYVQEEIYAPLGMENSWIGTAPEAFRDEPGRIGLLHSTQGATPLPFSWEREQRDAPYRPGGSGRGPMRELGWFLETLLFRGSRGGAQILAPQAVEALTARHRTGLFDHTFGHVMDWGLGFLVNSNLYGPETVPYGFGRHSSPRTFGHGGMQCASAFVDPEHGLVAALVANGAPGEPRHQQRFREINSALYEDLGLVMRQA